MQHLLRIIDANINRSAEGVRVLEDLARLNFSNQEMTAALKALRHDIRKSLDFLNTDLLKCRDADHDPGLIISQSTDLDGKASIDALIAANFKRVQEALRTIEETLKLAGYYQVSKNYESYRFRAYSLEKRFVAALGKDKHLARLRNDLYCITAENLSCGKSNLEVVKSLIASDIKIIQYREKDKSKLEKYRECVVIRDLTSAADVSFIVNDDVDLALAVGADGIHVGQDDTPVGVVRRLAGEKVVIGLSTHSSEQALKAVEQGADYIGVGPIFRTFTKKDVCEPVGLEYLAFAAKHIAIPFIAIGGIKENNLRQVVEAGAQCISIVSDIVGAPDIPGKIAQLRKILNQP